MNALLLSSLLAWALAQAGMTGLCLAMDRHFEQLTGRPAPPSLLRRGLALAGVLLVGSALWVCLSAWGSGVGWVAWLGFLTAGGLLTAGLWAWRPRQGALLAAGCAVVGGAAGAARALGLFGLLY